MGAVPGYKFPVIGISVVLGEGGSLRFSGYELILRSILSQKLFVYLSGKLLRFPLLEVVVNFIHYFMYCVDR